ncbi:MAG: thioredoxin-disulfide reductase [Bacilli bacterium]|nr:thioredoxin-disulfide reductase [Bacilli bacterium]
MTDIIIIGAGPAGLTAAIYARRAGKSVLILEALSYGGMIVNAKEVENYPGFESISGFDFATNLYNQVIKLGADIKYEKAFKIEDLGKSKKVVTNDNEYNAKAVIIATGVQNRKLGLKNENELLGKGVSYCATCDGAFYKDKVVSVIGGGNTAVGDAIYLSEYCKKVYVIYRKDKVRGDKIVVDKLEKKNNVEFIYNATVTELIGNDKLEKIEILYNNTDTRKTIKMDGLFVAIGQEPSNSNFEDLIKMDDKGYIIGDDGCHTNVKGIYVAGDTRVKEVRQLTTATSDGTIAALNAIKEMD